MMARVKPTRRKGGTPPAGAARKAAGKGKGGAVIQPRSSITLPTEHGWQQLNCSEDCNAQRGDMAERVTCDGCNRMWHAACLGLHAHDPSGKWHCASCTAMYRRGVEDGQQQVPAASQPTVAGTVAVAEPSSKRKKLCCQVPGCRQADNQHDYKSSYHLKTHHQQAHEEPRHGPCSRCGSMFKSAAGYQSHEAKQLECASQVRAAPAAPPGPPAVATPVVAVQAAPATAQVPASGTAAVLAA